MANDFFNHVLNRVPGGVIATDLHIDNVADEIAAGFDKLPGESELNEDRITYAVDTGVANAYAISLPKVTALTAGLQVRFLATNANTAASTLDVSSLGAVALKAPDGSALVLDDIRAGQAISATYTGTEFRITSVLFTNVQRTADSAAAAATSEANAATSEANAATSEANAATSASNAATSEVNAAASAALVADRPRKNWAVNGGCVIAQTAPITLTSAAQYGAVDMFIGYASSIPAAGTLTQAATSTLGETGYALHFAGVTMAPASNTIITEQRRISSDVLSFSNKSAILSCLVEHDAGVNVDYTLRIYRPATQDDFGSVMTQISVDSTVSVASGTPTRLELSVADLGDCSKGLMIELRKDTGAITAKNFYETEFQLERGSQRTDFENKSFQDFLFDCLPFFEKSYEIDVNPGTVDFRGQHVFRSSSTSVESPVQFSVRKIAPPSITLYSPATGSASQMRDVSSGVDVNANVYYTGSSAFMGAKLTGGVDGNQFHFHWVADARP